MPGQSAVADLKRKGYRVRTFGKDSVEWKKFAVRRNPTYVFMRDGQEVSRLTGAKPTSRLEVLWRKYTLFQ